MRVRLKGVIVTLIVNAFALMTVDVVSEINKLQSGMERLDYIFDNSVDMAIQNSMASEEFFSDEFQHKLGSYATNGVSASPITANLMILRDGWVRGNSYIMTMYCGEHGMFPLTQSAYDTFAEGITTEDVYEYLFGTVGDDTGSSALLWANLNYDGLYVHDVTARIPNKDFKEYYMGVGKMITSTQFVREKTVDSWTLKETELPVLAQMGLKLDAINESNLGASETGANYVSVVHRGKLLNGSLDRSSYYLTPYSLGVTYLPLDVLMVNIRANLENTIRFSKCKQLGNDASDIIGSQLMETYKSADGCIKTDYYVDSAGNPVSDPIEHKGSAFTWGSDTVRMMNDGQVEYDLTTLQVKVDYFTVDFYDNNNWRIVSAVEGAIPYSSDFTELPNKLRETDTSENPDGNRIVARVSAKIRLHIPYKSSVMQWYINKYGVSTTEHYDIARYDSATGDVITDADGVWYYYTTYVSISR